ncbi:uncharacterized protein LOC130729311 isoform X2 [Lotus japonicus]|uniref:uncharacterized protein LOC130729311 isoform X2 n=1 Tax=Lotus japonicus TaxID=34305 RepID=UPI002588A664|nr:uncharacterized protein LOC130729311 isoform X2 [Lotus japonicus]
MTSKKSIIDKSWIKKPRNTLEYLAGLNSFLDFAFEHNSGSNTIICPCDKCGFKKWHIRDEVLDHLLCKPFPNGYTFWHRHGETRQREFVLRTPSIEESTRNEDPIQSTISDAFGFSNRMNEEPYVANEACGGDENTIPELNQGMQGEAKEFYELLKD